MSNHIKILGVLHIIFGGFGLLLGLLAFMVLGGIAGIVGTVGGGGDSWIAVPILGGIGVFVLILAVVLSLPGLVAGIGLLGHRPWARILTLILSAFQLFHIPFGTLLGVYGIWVLCSGDSEQLFSGRERRAF